MVDINTNYEQRILRLKYSRDYFSALSKIQAKQINGYSDGEYELTKEENEALRCYINNSDRAVVKSGRSR